MKDFNDTLMYVLDMCASLETEEIECIIDNLEIMIENKQEEEEE